MSIRHLDTLLAPASIAVFGASERPGAIGTALLGNILRAGFKGALWAVNPRYREVQGLPCYPCADALPEAPALAVIATPFASVPDLIAVLGERGTRAAVVISAATGSASEAEAARRAMLEAARRHCLRIVGPNCLGLIAPRAGLDASFAHLRAAPGRLAFLTQSGAIVTSMLDWAEPRGIGFSHVVSLGDMSDVDFGDLLDYLANDTGTDAILLYIEAVTGARKFVSAARAAARMKPVVVVKGGRSTPGARAAATHTGAMIGADAVYDAVFRRTGLLRVYTLEELFNAAATLAKVPRLGGERLAIVSNGGGLGVLAADALAADRGCLAELAADTLTALDARLPANWSRANPVDVVGDADPVRLASAVSIVAADPGVDALLAIHCPTAVCPSVAAAEALCAVRPNTRTPLLLASWVGGEGAERARDVFSDAGVPCFPMPEQAIRAFMQVVDYQRGQRALMETPGSMPELRTIGAGDIAARVRAALAAGRQWLSAEDTRAVLAAYGFRVLASERAADADAAAAIAARLGVPVALKVLSPDIVHKTDVGGVALDLRGADATRAAALAMLAGIRQRQSGARIEGFLVEPMAEREQAWELLLGMSCDAQFGPVIAFGHGGTATEQIADSALALPPLNLQLARELIARTRVARLLGGARGLPGTDLDAVALALVQLSELVCDLPEVTELDINPLLAGPAGCTVIDARIRIAPAAAPGSARLAIKPYPRELESEIALADGRRLWLRPVRPEDEPALVRAFGTLTPEEVYLRFFAPLKSMTHLMGARFTQIDYDRQMTFMLTERGAPGTTPYYGSVNLICDPDMQRAEFAIMVHHEMAGRGLGRRLMQRIIDYARSRGIHEIDGDVLAHNTPMLDLCRSLGFTPRHDPADPGVVRVQLSL